MNGKVWVAHDRGGYDFSNAEKYGEIRAVFNGDFNPFDLRGAYAKAKQILHEHGHPDDWVILVGSSVACAIVTLAANETWGHLNLLVFHAQRREYVKRELPLGAQTR